MPNALYIDNETAQQFNGTVGADVAFSMEGVADGAGRVSAQYNAGAAPRAYIYHWSCEVQWQATPDQYGTLDLYVAEAPDGDSTQISGDQGSSDAALGDVDATFNMRYIGRVVSENATASEVCVSSGTFQSFARYFSIVGVNNGGATINATDSNFNFRLEPKFIEAQ